MHGHRVLAGSQAADVDVHGHVVGAESRKRFAAPSQPDVHDRRDDLRGKLRPQIPDVDRQASQASFERARRNLHADGDGALRLQTQRGIDQADGDVLPDRIGRIGDRNRFRDRLDGALDGCFWPDDLESLRRHGGPSNHHVSWRGRALDGRDDGHFTASAFSNINAMVDGVT
jgi:hypothetical protein